MILKLKNLIENGFKKDFFIKVENMPLKILFQEIKRICVNAVLYKIKLYLQNFDFV